MSALEEILASVDVPVPADSSIPADGRVTRHAERLIGPEVAGSLWRKWHSDDVDRVDDPAFCQQFGRFLASGFELGYRLGRFERISAELPRSNANAHSWISLFEQVVEAEDCCRVRLFLDREQQHHIHASDSWGQRLDAMTDQLFWELGIVFPPIALAVDDALEPAEFRIEWNDLWLPAQRGISQGRVLVNDTVDRLTLLSIKGEEAVNPVNGSECAIIDQSYETIAEQAGLTVWDPLAYIILALSATIRRAAPSLVNRASYELLRLRLRDFSPQLVSVVDERLDPDFMLQVFRALLSEEIGIRNLPAIYHAALELRCVTDVDLSRYIVFGPTTGGTLISTKRDTADLNPQDVAEFVRWNLRRYISHKYTRGGNTIIVYLLDPKLEELLSETLRVADEEAIFQAFENEIGNLPPTAQTPVVLTTTLIRHKLFRMMSRRFPHMAVLSYQELSPDMNIQPIARISLE